jgi:hypothetical protein
MRTTVEITDRNLQDGPQYALGRDQGLWEVVFEGWHGAFKHEPGAPYVAWLLLHPPRKPIHALLLALEARALSGQTPGAAEIVQQRYLGLDEAEAVRNLRRRERELEAVLDDDDAIEPVKAEALRELEAIAAFMRKHPWRSRDCVQKCARAVGLAIRCLHARLAGALDTNGKPHLVLQAFARHLNEHLLFPSDGGGIPGRFRVGAALPGWFTYEPPDGVVWTPKKEVQSLESSVQGSRLEVRGSMVPRPAAVERVSPSPHRVQGSKFEVQGSMVPRPAAVERLATFLSVGLAFALLATGCASTRPLRGGKAVTTHKPEGSIEQTIVQSENPSQVSKQTQESVKVRSYTVPAGSRIEQCPTPGIAAPQAAPSTAATYRPSTLNSQPSTSYVLTAPMPVVEREETHAATELGAAQKDTARELGAKLSSLKGIVWVGAGLFVFGLASLVWPPLKVIIGSVTTSAALMLGGLALMVLPSLIVGNELLILGGVAVTVGGWFLAHRHGQLRGLVAASTQKPSPGNQ